VSGPMLFLHRRRLLGKAIACAALVAAIMQVTPAASGLVPSVGPNKVVRIFLVETLATLIGGEFAGRRVPGDRAYGPPCKPEDFESLRAGGNPIRTEQFVPSCRIAEFRLEEAHMHVTSYLPSGSCEVIRNAFDDILKQAIYGRSDPSISYEYKGAKYSTAKHGDAVRGAQLQASCQADGSLRVTALRQNRQPR